MLAFARCSLAVTGRSVRLRSFGLMGYDQPAAHESFYRLDDWVE